MAQDAGGPEGINSFPKKKEKKKDPAALALAAYWRRRRRVRHKPLAGLHREGGGYGGPGQRLDFDCADKVLREGVEVVEGAGDGASDPLELNRLDDYFRRVLCGAPTVTTTERETTTPGSRVASTAHA